MRKQIRCRRRRRESDDVFVFVMYPARLCMNLFAIVVQFTWVGRQAGKQASGVEACGRV